MRRIASIGAVFVAGFFLLACAERISTAERLTLVNNTIASTARVAETALAQGHIDVKTACQVEVYGRLAGAAVDAGFTSYVTNDAEGAVGHLQAAQSILNGVSAEAAAQVQEECN